MNRACGSSSTGAVEKEEGSVSCGMELPGFRFHPTDEELVSFYLRKRVLHQHGEKDHILVALQHLIPDLDIYKYDPWDLPRLARLGEGSSGCYFFSPRDRKYRNSTRPNRVTSSGFWKATGTDRHVYSGGSTSVCVGLKKSLVFYLGRSSTGTKTDWMMHEFRIPSRPEDTCWALCKIFKRKSNSSQCVSEMQAFAAEEVPCAAEATLDKLEAVDSFGGEDCSEEDSKSENTICVLPTPTSDGPITSFADIHTPSSDTSQDEVAMDCLVRSSEMTECDLPSSVKTEPLTVRVSKGSDFWSDDLWSLFPSPATMKPFDNSRFTGQPCFLGDPNLPFTDHSDQESLQASMPECLWHLLSSPQWNPALPLPLWDQPAYFHD